MVELRYDKYVSGKYIEYRYVVWFNDKIPQRRSGETYKEANKLFLERIQMIKASKK